jgi:cell division protein FtsL
MFATLVAVVSALGVARIWVSVRAIEASFEANQLRADIRSERYEGDMLEVRQSALGSPSRIREIAGRAMDMAPANQVTYLQLREPAKSESRVSRAGVADIPVLRKLVAAFKELTAGEAEMLLVGDVGLTSTR